MKLCKLLLAALSATVLLGALTSSASARSISVTSQTLRSTFREVRFAMPFGTTNCQVTLEGSLHARTIAKIAATLVGYINRATLGTCSAGAATILTETLPWHGRYRSFTGTLPNIATIRIDFVDASFRVREPFGITCLARSTAAQPAVGTFNISGGFIQTAEIGGTIRTGAECFGEEGSFTSDRGGITAGNNTTRIGIRLI